MHFRFVRLLMLLAGCLMAFAAAAASPDPLPAEIRQVLRHQGISDRGLSIYAHELGQPEPVLAFHADVARNPASTMKLLTTLVALEELGPAWTWKTEAYATAPLRDGVLDGDLYIKGYGDPFLVIEHFWRFLRALRKAGLDEIRGDLVIDQSYFDPRPVPAARFDRRPQQAYNVQPHALLVNFQAVNFRFIPEPAASQPRIVADPQPAQMVIDNRVRLGSGPCRGGARGLGVQVSRKAEVQKVVFSGRYSRECGEDELYRVVAEGDDHVQGVFRTIWQELGGRLRGGVRSAPVPSGARLLHAADSPPLAEILRAVNKYSNNVMTRQMLLTVGAEKFGAPGTEEKGFAAVHDWLQRHQLEFPELVLENGSGLSRDERISARHLADVLRIGWDSPFMPEYLASLPILAMDGTLRHRSGALAGRAHLKTGSINDVRAKAGIVLDGRNRRMVVVIMHNDARADTAAGEMVQQAVLDWISHRP